MKYPIFAALPAWHVWSDGRKFTPSEVKGMRRAWKHCRVPGETPRRFFVRIRHDIELHYARKGEGLTPC